MALWLYFLHSFQPLFMLSVFIHLTSMIGSKAKTPYVFVTWFCQTINFDLQ